MLPDNYLTFFEISFDACLVTTQSCVIVQANLTAQQLFLREGAIADEISHLKDLTDKNLVDFVVDSAQDYFDQRVAHLRNNIEAKIPTWELQLQASNGEPFSARVNAFSAYSSDQELYFYWCIQGLKSRESAIEALKQTNNALEKKVQQKTQEISTVNKALQKKIKILRQAQIAFKRHIRQRGIAENILSKIHQALELDEVLDILVTEVRQYLNTDRVLIYRFKPDWSGVVVLESIAPGMMPILYTTIDEPCFRDKYVALYQQGRVKAIADVYQADIDSCHLRLLKSFQVRANLVVPIISNGDLWGLLIAHHCKEPRHWTQDEIQLLSELAIEAGIAIRQADLYQKWQRLATVDSLTNIPNRHQFDTYIRETWQQYLKTQSTVTFVIADIDFFKQYNDIYGHPAGDTCLRQIASVMSSTFRRTNDLVARYGGEEFVFVLPNTNIDDALRLLGRLRKSIQQLDLKHQGSPFKQVTLSYGISSTVFHSGDTVESLINAADQALYRAKAKGRNCIGLPDDI